MREAKPWRFEFGVGYATEEGFRGFVTLGNDNLFGTGRSACLTERMSEKGYRTELHTGSPGCSAPCGKAKPRCSARPSTTWAS